MAGSRQSTESLTGVRALAAAWVLVFHLYTFANPLWAHGPIAEAFSSQGYLGVDFFFVLSGFILALQYLGPLARPTRGAVTRFLLLRLARIYPLHILTMVGVAVMAFVGAMFGKNSANPHQLSLLGAFANLLLIHSWGWLTTYSWNEPSWSISCEWFAYLCFPLVAIWYSRIRRPASAVLASSMPLLVLFAALSFLGESTINQTLHYGLLRISGEFLSGCGIFVLVRLGVAARLPSWSASAVLLILAAMIAYRVADPWAPCAFSALILALVANPRSLLARALATPVMVTLGELSYSLYMVNQRVILWINRVVPYSRATNHPPLFRFLMASTLFLGIVLLAWLMHAFAERPLREYARRFIDRWFPRETAEKALLADAVALPKIETVPTRG